MKTFLNGLLSSFKKGGAVLGLRKLAFLTFKLGGLTWS
jgi:hypothetical protein